MTKVEQARSSGRNLLAGAVDWDLAAKTGAAIAPTGPKISRHAAEQVVAGLTESAARAEAPVRDVTGLADGLPVPAAEVLDRPGWITAAAGSMARMTGSTSAERTGLFGGKPAGVQAGAMLAFLSTAVLGQYDPFSSETVGADASASWSLLLIAPNIVAAERALDVNAADFRLWVCLHEVTHRVQFSSVPWLADYLRDTVGVLGEAGEEPLSEVVGRVLAEVRQRRGASRDDSAPHGVIGLLRATQAPPQRDALDKLLVLGTLLEGHADHVMDAVGPTVVPTVGDIRQAFDKRRKRPTNPVQRLLRALLGMDAKLAQYIRGKAFVDAVVDRVGMEQFNAIWTDSTTLPLPDEIGAPQNWVARVLG